MNALKKVVRALGIAFSSAILSLVYLAAVLLAPWRIGRLLKSVSIPRFHEHRLRTSLTIVGISLGVAVLIAVVLINRSILGSFAATIEDISGKADLQVTGGGSGFDETRLDAVREVPGVARVTPVLQTNVLMRAPDANGERMLLIGVDFLGEDDEYFRSYDSPEMPAIKDDPIAFLNSPTNIILSRQLAERFGYKLRDKIPLATPTGTQEFQIWGFIDDDGVGRAFGGAIGVMYYQAMQAAFDRGTNIDRLDIAVTPGLDPVPVAEALRAKLGAGFEVDRPERRNDRVSQMLAGLNTGLLMGSLIALLVGMFLIYNTMSISVVQRKKELGILRALGTTKRQVLSLFVLEGTLMGAVGSVLGVFLGLLLARVLLGSMAATISEIYMQVQATNVTLDPLLLVGGLVLGLGATVFSSFVPAREATRISAVDALRTGGMMTVAGRKRRFTQADGLALVAFAAAIGLLQVPPWGQYPMGGFAAAFAVTVGGVLLAPRLLQMVRAFGRLWAHRLLGIEGAMANENVPRDMRRAAITTGALMTGVAMTTAFAAFIGSFKASTFEWIDQSVPADLFVTSAARFGGVKNVPMADVLKEPLQAIEGVDLVERIRIADQDYSGVTIKVLNCDIEIYIQRSTLTFLEGDAQGAIPALLAGGVIISENMMRRFGLHLGDTMTLSTIAGAREFKVAGVIVDYTSDQGSVVMDRKFYVEFWGDARVDTYKLYLRPGYDPELVRKEINRRYTEKFDLFVLTNSEFKGQLVDLLDQVFAIIRALELVAIIIAVLGVVNSLLASVLDRIRELGVLRAIGMLRRQVRKMVMVEAGFIGLASIIGGIAVGLVLGWILLYYINVTQTGWYLPFRPAVLPLLESAGLVLLVSILAGWYPAREAASLPVADALEYE